MFPIRLKKWFCFAKCLLRSLIRILKDNLRYVLLSAIRFLRSHTTSNHGLFCRKHNCEHVGKNAYAALLEIYFQEYFDQKNSSLLNNSIERLRHIAFHNFAREREYCYSHFVPGTSHLGANINNVIDGGCCVDAFSTALKMKLGNPRFRKIAKHIIQQVSDEYLTEKVVSGAGIPNQVLWGGTGIASAIRAGIKPKIYLNTISNLLENIIGLQYSDGSFPYTPQGNLRAFSPYYQGRCSAFMAFILNNCELDATLKKKTISSLKEANKFLQIISSPDGDQYPNLENKRWYWDDQNSPNRTSYPFDIYSLISAWKLTGDNNFGLLALRKFDKLRKDIEKRNCGIQRIPPKLSGMDYQCPLFWNSHIIWLARAVPDLLSFANRHKDIIHPSWQNFVTYVGTEFIRHDSPWYSALLRFKRDNFDALFGSNIGAGAFVDLIVFKGNKWKSVFSEPFKWHKESSLGFYCRLKKGNCLSTTLKRNIRCLKRQLLSTWVFLKGNEPRRRITRHFGLRLSRILQDVLFLDISSAWSLDYLLKSSSANRILLSTVIPATRAGIPFSKFRVNRKIFFSDECLKIEDKSLVYSFSNIKELGYSVPWAYLFGQDAKNEIVRNKQRLVGGFQYLTDSIMINSRIHSEIPISLKVSDLGVKYVAKLNEIAQPLDQQKLIICVENELRFKKRLESQSKNQFQVINLKH